MDAIHGVTLEVMAETMSKHNELRTQYGEPAFGPHFVRYLGAQGLDEARWAQAWNSWHARLDADKTGQLWSRFTQLQSALAQKAHFGDVEDMSQQVRGGLSLDLYARLSAELAQPGADFAAVLASCGVSVETWNSGRAAWNEAMAADTMHKITTQYGQLYAKYNPAHVAAMHAQAGQIAAGRAASSSQEDEPEEEYTADKAIAELSSPTPRTRWRAAHLLAQKIQTELSDDAAGRQRALTACEPVLLEALERHDKETVSSAEAAARDLVELERFTDDAKGAITRCLRRGREHLATVQAAFAPIQNKNVPERIYLQSEIQDYTSLVETLEEILGEWDEKASRGAAASEAPRGEAAHGGGDDADDLPLPGGLAGLWRKLMSLFK